jgi:hypothetical protein
MSRKKSTNDDSGVGYIILAGIVFAPFYWLYTRVGWLGLFAICIFLIASGFGIYAWRSHRKQAIKVRAPSELPVRIGKHVASVPELGNFTGPLTESPNGEYWVVCKGSGSSSDGKGKYALIHQGKVSYVGECDRPMSAVVANSGIFAVEDSGFVSRNTLGSTLFVHSASGDLLVTHEFSANVYNLGISKSGRYILAQLCNSKTNDSNRLFLFDIENPGRYSSFEPESGWADEYEFCESERIIILLYEGVGYRYSFDGDFFDQELYENDYVENASADTSVFIVRDRIKDTPKESLPELMALLSRALKDESSMRRPTLALAYKLKGVLLEAMDDTGQAILAYQRALDLDPKIGVKKKLNQLIKESK